MTKTEQKVLAWVKAHGSLLAAVLVSILGMVMRYPLRNIVSSDAAVYLLPWFAEMKERGGLAALSSQIGDYSILYQFCIALMTYIPVEPLYQYKLLSVFFDYLLAAGIAVLVYGLYDGTGNTAKKSRAAERAALVSYALTLCSMIVVMNSAAWGQCDSIYAALCIWSMVFLLRERYAGAFVILGLAFGFKLHAVFIMPFFLFVYFYRKRFSVLYFVLIPAVMTACGIPGYVMGRKVWEGITVYVNHLPAGQLYMVYPSFWAFLPDVEAGSDGFAFMDFYRYKPMALFFTVAVLAMLIMLLLYAKPRLEGRQAVSAAFLLVLSTVFFMPVMRDRYGFLYEMLAIPVAVLDRKTIPPALALHILMYFHYAGRLGQELLPFSMAQFSGMLLILFLWYLMILLHGMIKENVYAKD
ncbi:MAG: DUF2029 domain-containing protein [Lachnospiraceae bacterium]|nr:DUF2029 domain-containing protein [Lachnospiraceae bacterium]